MKRVLALITVCILLVSLAACGGKKTDASWPGADTSNGKQNTADDNSGGNGNSGAGKRDEDTGMALTDFSSEFIDAVGSVSGRFEAVLNASEINPMRQLELNAVTMIIALVATYDLYDNALTAGLVRDNGGYREKNGNIITFGEDYKRTEANVYSKNQAAGDHEVIEGKVDLSTNTVTWESYTERDGVKISRTVLEGVLNKDGSVMMQFLAVDIPQNGIDPEGKAIFITADANNLKVIRGTFTHDTGFTFTSIVGKNAMTAEDMAAGYTLVWNIVSDLEKAESTKY